MKYLRNYENESQFSKSLRSCNVFMILAIKVFGNEALILL